ncbi:MAG: hypothetical protein ABSA32_11325 [Candidatus Acidiferrales bacterium]
MPAMVAFYFLFSLAQENATAATAPLSYPVQDTKRAKEGVMPANFPLFVFLAVGALSFFAFLAVATWAGTRLKEREAFYESETLKKFADMQGGGANPVLELLREKEKIARTKQTEGIKLGGLVTLASGIGLMIFIAAAAHSRPAFLVGLIPLLVGLALLAYALFMAPKD